MLRGYRLFIVAIGLILAAASPPPNVDRQKATDSAPTKVERSLEDMAATLREANKPSDLDQPCEEGDNKRSSDLCAQWKAADAAASGASAAWLFGSLGTLIGLLTLGAASAAAYFAKKAADHTETGAKAAQDAVNETQRIGEAQVRCYLSFESVLVACQANGLDYVGCTIRNSGQSPALNVAWRAMANFILNNEKRESPLLKGSMFDSVETIGSQISHEFVPIPVEFKLNRRERGYFAKPNDGIGIAVVVNVFATYEDVFGATGSIRQNFVGMLTETPKAGQKIYMRALGRLPQYDADYTADDDKHPDAEG